MTSFSDLYAASDQAIDKAFGWMAAATEVQKQFDARWPKAFPTLAEIEAVATADFGPSPDEAEVITSLPCVRLKGILAMHLAMLAQDLTGTPFLEYLKRFEAIRMDTGLVAVMTRVAPTWTRDVAQADVCQLTRAVGRWATRPEVAVPWDGVRPLAQDIADLARLAEDSKTKLYLLEQGF